ncbi:MAG: nucleotidyltransferase family protein [Elusimicrobiota bacterium]
MCDTCVILAAGKGKRLKKEYPDTPKPLVNISGKPMIYYPVKNFYTKGIRNFIIVVNKETKRAAEELYGYFKDVEIKTALQNKAKGTALALKCAQNKIKKESFYLAYCDNIGKYDCTRLDSLIDCDRYIGGVFITKNADNPSTALAGVKNNEITGIIEKPNSKRKEFILYPIFIFKKEIIKYIAMIKKPADKEIYLADAVNKAIQNGRKLGYKIENSPRLNVNTPLDVKKASKLVSFLNLQG